MRTRTLGRGAIMTRLANPVSSTGLHIRQRTSRSFTTTDPPDDLCAFLIDKGFQPIRNSSNPHEYARLGRGTWHSRPVELVILFWNGSVLCQGTGWQRAARLLESIAEEAAGQMCLFDLLDEEEQ